MAESETSTNGDLIIRGKIHGHAFNCVVTLHQPLDGESWWFAQFLTRRDLEQYAAEWNLRIIEKEADDGTQGA